MLTKVKLILCLTFRRMILQRSYILLTNVGENGKIYIIHFNRQTRHELWWVWCSVQFSSRWYL